MATSDPLPHGPDVLDPLFQRMRACGLAPREVQGRILKALKCEELVIIAHVVAGAWSLLPRQLTREEEAQARAATRKYDYDAYNAILYEQSPPDGITGPIAPESWEVKVTIAIRDGHLIIEFLDPDFPPESYSFAIATPEAVDKLLAAASPAQASSAAVNLNSPVPEPPRLASENPRGAGAKRGFDREFILIEAAAYVMENDLPPSLEGLVQALQLTLKDKMPKDTQGKKILGPFFRRMKRALGR